MKRAFLLIFILIFTGSYAQHDHGGAGDEHEDSKDQFKYVPQHGGELVEAGKYKFEILIDPTLIDEKISVYVLKKRNHKEVELKDASGKVEIKYKDGTVEQLDLKMYSEKLGGEPKQVGQAANYCFIIVINRKEYRPCYFYKGLFNK